MEASPINPVLTAIIVFAFIGIPSVFSLRKAGWNGWWCLLFAIPVVNVIALWVFAFGRWPNESGTHLNHEDVR